MHLIRENAKQGGTQAFGPIPGTRNATKKAESVSVSKLWPLPKLSASNRRKLKQIWYVCPSEEA